ncbi:CorA family divalent cation transporter [Erythrobacter mangrovi]|uniref:Zinc transporter ZntB n=1 Tax=Erythrobacter mangrovi TaxID=2739433 RepID=A0A7D3XQK6_9SPHN|nr:CorA family divalent cation transporter [Erythrobacter mangrovi]QKG70551.1 zinc transporter ZntB [Erythrobacter mangrovi]
MMEPNDDIDHGSPLLFGRVLDGEGGGRAIDWEEAQVWQPAAPGEVMWIHLDRTRSGLREWLETTLEIPEPTAELLTSDQNRPRAFRDGKTLVATLRGINFNPGAEPEDMISMQLWSDGRRLVTLRRHPLQTPREIVAQIDRRMGPPDAGATITLLAELMITRMSQSIVDMNEVIDQLEEDDPERHAEAMLRRISIIRRNCLALKRHMAPQHEALEHISRDAPAWFEHHDRREIAESIARLRRYLDDIDISKESALVLQDEIRARTLASSEHATYMLTVVAGIFLPLSFLTGLLGINVGGMPGMDDPRAFWMVVALCLLVLSLLIVTFRRLRWL